MKSRKKLPRLILQLLLLILVGGYLTTNIVQSTFASNKDIEPNVIITINSDGSISQTGSLFGDNLLYPATVEDAEKGIGGISGVIRINNHYKRINVSNLRIGLDKNELIYGNGYPRDTVYSSFLRDIELKIERGRIFSFDKTLVEYTSLENFLYEPGSKSYKGYTLDKDKDKEFIINKGDTVDLKYVLHMVLEAGNELQDVTAKMPIYINIHELPVVEDGGDEDRGYGGHDQEKSTKAVEPLGSVSIKSHWSHDCIITLLNHGIITGYPHEKYTIEDYFNGMVEPVVYVNEAVLPDRFVTRAETAVLVGRALNLQEQQGAMDYIDYIPSWARGYVIATSKANIFTGYPSGEFKPNNHITREEMIAVLIRTFEISLEDESLELPFKDKEDIGNWALEYVKAGYEKRIIVGYPNNTYRPKNPITRAETFTIICKLLGLHEHEQ